MPPKKLVIKDKSEKLPEDFNRSQVEILEVPERYQLPSNFSPQALKLIIVDIEAKEKGVYVRKNSKKYNPSMPVSEIQKFINSPEPTRNCPTGSFWVGGKNISNYEVEKNFPFYNIERESEDISLQEKCDLIKKFSLSKEWRRKLKKYLLSLPEIERRAIESYTFVGDRVLNEFYRRGLASAIALIRKQHFFPFTFAFSDFLNFFRDNNTLSVGGYGVLKSDRVKVRGKNTQEKIEALEALALQTPDDKRNRALVLVLSDFSLAYCILASAQYLINIFKKIPPLDKDVLLFRGVGVDLFEKEKRFKTLGFSSTSNDPGVAWSFAKDAYVLRLFVPRGTRCIPIFGFLSEVGFDESEMLFPPGTILSLEGCVGESEGAALRDELKGTALCDVGVTENIEDLDCQKIAADWKKRAK